MCEIGWRVIVKGGVDSDGEPVPPGATGIVVGHMGLAWAIVSLDQQHTGTAAGKTVLIHEGSVRPVNRNTRSVVMHPDGRATPLSRGDSHRVHIRPPK